MAGDSYRIRIASGLFDCAPQSLGSYFDVYDKLLARGDVHALQIEDPEPGIEHLDPITDDDILLAAGILRSDPTLTLDQAIEQLRTRLGTGHSSWQLRRTILLSVRAALMLDAETGLARPRVRWQPSEPFVDFASRCIPSAPAMSATVMEALDGRNTMKAWKLKSRLNLSFEGTDDIAFHLYLDREHPNGPTLYLFHYLAYIKARLYGLKRVNLHGEDNMLTLHSMQTILFHFDDQKSTPIIKRLIDKDGFEKTCGQAGGSSVLDDADKLEYRYWGERLAKLYRFTHERPPRNKLERWMKWQSAESNAFVIAVAALVISIAVGVLSLGLGGVQTWIAWGAWNNPVSNDEETTTLLREIAELLRQQQGRRRA
ncbi:hypothetical protein NEMBOFW57_010359 [Staphylotrichum longicolle]|uniref:Uncharacterized protein n=1 Tax=Staphylotrichum longicolle TaxID=669026 RepID=A0AAD4EMX7_9PEZI|nr:hypothetical protein NEMBOFW57_010359 [Staphylotrichum longicolle]